VQERIHTFNFESARLVALPLGVIDLGVPILRDAIQIRAEDMEGRARIVVEKTPSQVSIRRADGIPLQVDLNPHYIDERLNRDTTSGIVQVPTNRSAPVDIRPCIA
jgi:hypothetical protein